MNINNFIEVELRITEGDERLAELGIETSYKEYLYPKMLLDITRIEAIEESIWKESDFSLGFNCCTAIMHSGSQIAINMTKNELLKIIEKHNK